MAIKILMPALSPTMTEGSLTKWLVKEGDQIKAGDILAEIETDKATMEVEAVDEGVVEKLLVNEGGKSIAVNSAIAMLNVNEKNFSRDKIKITNVQKEQVDEPVVKKKLSNNSKNFQKYKRRIFASPYVKNKAKKENIDLRHVSGSGPDGRIIKRDLKNNNTNLSLEKNYEENSIQITSIRKIIAEKTTLTKKTVPHFYLTIESNVDNLLEIRKKINETSDTKISINDILVKALALTQYKNPSTNVSWINDKIIKNNSVDVSIAVALEEGLVTPIVKEADKKGLIKISKEIKELIEKAKKGKLLPVEYLGGTITISNLGMFGVSEFSAIINSPQSSILAVGAIKKIPGIIKDKVQSINILKSTLSADHRVLDGAVAGKFLKDFNDIIENPYDLWLQSNDLEII